MFPVEQVFPREHSADVAGEARSSMQALDLPDLSGKRIAVTAGSRGITDIVLLLRSVVGFLKSRGALPFLVPAMGSHGGASADGQLGVLASLGITEVSVGAPIRSSMETVLLGQTRDGFPAWCDRLAFESDGIVVCNRVKAHTDFKLSVESGLCKMMAVGLGKHKGAAAIHGQGVARLGQSILSAAEVFLERAPLLFGLAVVENAYEETIIAEAVPPSLIIVREEYLLRKAKAAMGRILLTDIDILVVEEIGKEISGAGMDPNISGRPMKGAQGFSELISPEVVVVLGVTEHSAGNAVGIGLADITTLNAVRNLDLASTYTNGITAGDIRGCAIPLIANSDRDALVIALAACAPKNAKACRVVQVRNTLELSSILVSEAFRDEIAGRNDLVVRGPAWEFSFSPEGAVKRIEIV
jgi:hypothetical protein